MATPRGAEHRDLEQRFKNLERTVRHLVSAALRREQLRVSRGDFVVSGGGDVVVQDGGSLRAEYASGRTAAEFGELDPTQVGDDAYGVRVLPDADPGTPGVSNALLEAFTSPIVGEVVRSYATGFVSFRGGEGMILTAGPTGQPADATVMVTTAGVQVDGPNGLDVVNQLKYLNAPTSSAAANLRYDTDNGVIKLITSSLRYKQDVQDAEVDPAAVLQLRPRTWRDRAEVARDPETGNRYVGFIAEEVHEAGLTDLVSYDDEGRPDALQYDRFSVALVELAKRQQQQLDDQGRRIADLESRLEALGA
jgi:hypothetical protein